MIENKYLIMIGIVVCLLILYYFYDEISNVKKLFAPTYQKTMALEAKIVEMDRRTSDLINRKRPREPRIDSPALSITYQSDMIKNNNLSARYCELTETEARRLLEKLENKQKSEYANLNQPMIPVEQNIQNLPHAREGKCGGCCKPSTNLQTIRSLIESEPLHINNTYRIQNVEPVTNHNGNMNGNPINNIYDLSEIDMIPNESINKINMNGEIYNDETDTINVKISNIITKKEEIAEAIKDSIQLESYQNILNGFSKTNIDSDMILDADVIRSITETLNYPEMPSEDENMLSDISSGLPISMIKTKKNSKIPELIKPGNITKQVNLNKTNNQNGNQNGNQKGNSKGNLKTKRAMPTQLTPKNPKKSVGGAVNKFNKLNLDKVPKKNTKKSGRKLNNKKL